MRYSAGFPYELRSNYATLWVCIREVTAEPHGKICSYLLNKKISGEGGNYKVQETRYLTHRESLGSFTFRFCKTHFNIRIPRMSESPNYLWWCLSTKIYKHFTLVHVYMTQYRRQSKRHLQKKKRLLLLTINLCNLCPKFCSGKVSAPVLLNPVRNWGCARTDDFQATDRMLHNPLSDIMRNAVLKRHQIMSNSYLRSYCHILFFDCVWNCIPFRHKAVFHQSSAFLFRMAFSCHVKTDNRNNWRSVNN